MPALYGWIFNGKAIICHPYLSGEWVSGWMDGWVTIPTCTCTTATTRRFRWSARFGRDAWKRLSTPDEKGTNRFLYHSIVCRSEEHFINSNCAECRQHKSHNGVLYLRHVPLIFWPFPPTKVHKPPFLSPPANRWIRWSTKNQQIPRWWWWWTRQNKSKTRWRRLWSGK